MRYRKKSHRLPGGGSCFTLCLVLLLSCMGFRCSNSSVQQNVSKGSTGTTYTTKFPLTENPISEGGMWINGKQVGIDWSNVATIPGLAYGTESGSGAYDDSTALLAGNWGSNQAIEATVHSANQSDSVYEEVELRLRSSLSAHISTGYEVNFRCSKSTNAYAQIVRWDGALGSFTYLSQQRGAQYGVSDGDVVRATMIGNVITVYINGVQIMQTSDSTYASGNPGMGFFLSGSGVVSTDYGLTSFTASDQI